MKPGFWQALVKYGPFWLGVIATTIMLASAMGILSFSTAFGQGCALTAALLNAYGIHGVAAWSPPREPWTPEQKAQESMRRIAMGMPPLVGYEYLLTGRGGPGPGPDPTLPPPPLFTPAPPPLPPAPDPPIQDVPPKKGA
jgi:hypothetical protein